MRAVGMRHGRALRSEHDRCTPLQVDPKDGLSVFTAEALAGDVGTWAGDSAPRNRRVRNHAEAGTAPATARMIKTKGGNRTEST